MRSINLVVIHCSATPDGVFVSPKQIDAWHAQNGFRRAKGFADKYRPALPHIGYHWVITADGAAHPARHREEVGAHVAGQNANSLGICMTGTDRFFLAQWDALRLVLCSIAIGLSARADLELASVTTPQVAIQKLRELGVRVCGHRDLSPDKDGDGVIEPHEWLKACPGFDVAGWLARLMQPHPKDLLDEDIRIAHPSPVTRVNHARRAA